MAIELRLSSKTFHAGTQEVLIRATRKGINLRAKTDVFIDGRYFEYNINVAETLATHPHLRLKDQFATKREAEIKGYTLYDRGQIIPIHANRIIDEVKRLAHEEGRKKIEALVMHIENQFNNLTNSQIESAGGSKWLQDTVDRFWTPDKFETFNDGPRGMSIVEFSEMYLGSKNYSEGYKRSVRVVIRCVKRFEMFIQSTDPVRRTFCFHYDKITPEDLEEFRSYLRNEHLLVREYPNIFEEINAVCKDEEKRVRGGDKKGRSENYISNLMKRLRSVFYWMREKKYTQNNPFDTVKVGSEKYGTPIYISIDERNQIAEAPMPTKHLDTQRDIFVFQCLIGCRVGDLMQMTEKNITDGILEYIPHKTIGETGVTARIPLIDKALSLIEKYKDVDAKGRLFPFISPQKYNDAIKEVFKQADVVRDVQVRDPKSGDIITRPINEIASSHMARRTFVGNLYFQVQDPNLIGKMSGHTDGSRAFSRYRRIEDDTLREVINLIK